MPRAAVPFAFLFFPPPSPFFSKVLRRRSYPPIAIPLFFLFFFSKEEVTGGGDTTGRLSSTFSPPPSPPFFSFGIGIETKFSSVISSLRMSSFFLPPLSFFSPFCQRKCSVSGFAFFSFSFPLSFFFSFRVKEAKTQRAGEKDAHEGRFHPFPPLPLFFFPPLPSQRARKAR